MKYNLVVAILFASCTKHAGDIPEHIPNATLVITKPTEGQVFFAGDSISVGGTAISDEIIHGYDVYITKQNDTTKLYSLHVHDHNDTLVIEKKFKYENAYRGNLEAHVLLTLDHDGHELHRKVNCKVQ